MKRVKSDIRATLSDLNLSNCMAVLLECATFKVFNIEPALQLWWEAKLRRLGGKGRGKTRRKRVVRSENVDVIEVDGSEEEDLKEDEHHIDDFYDSPSEDEGECLRKKGCVESESEDECIGELESD